MESRRVSVCCSSVLLLGVLSRTFALWGLRGVGKTVLLNRFAAEAGWGSGYIELRGRGPLRPALAQVAVQAAQSLARRESVRERLRRSLSVISGFSVTAMPTGITFKVDVAPRLLDAVTAGSSMSISRMSWSSLVRRPARLRAASHSSSTRCSSPRRRTCRRCSRPSRCRACETRALCSSPKAGTSSARDETHAWDEDPFGGAARRLLPLRPARAGVCRSTAGVLGSRPKQARRA
jgi:hypothetical protein